jgi:hypothetical protein
MKWDQIESKWALMTRRIRADWGGDHVEATEMPIRGPKRREAVPQGIADRQAFAPKESELKTSVK